MIAFCDVCENIDMFSCRIGGGPQSHGEIKAFKKLKPECKVFEKDVPLIKKV
jgi:hypothetical protein